MPSARTSTPGSGTHRAPLHAPSGLISQPASRSNSSGVTSRWSSSTPEAYARLKLSASRAVRLVGFDLATSGAGWTALAATVLAGGILAGFGPVTSSAAPAINVQLVWSRTFAGVTFRESSPVPAALTTPAYVVGALDGKVYAFDAATGNDEPGWPVATTNPVNSSPAAADVLGTGHSVVFVGSGEAATTVAGACSGGGAYAIEYAGRVRWHNIGSDGVCANQPFHSSFAIGDTDGDGIPTRPSAPSASRARRTTPSAA